MQKKPSFAELMNERLHLFDDHRNVVTPEMKKREQAIIEGLIQNSKCGNRSVSLLDMHLGRYTYHLSAHKRRLKHAVIDINVIDNWKYANLLCPKEDQYRLAESEILFYKRLMSLPAEQCKQLVMINIRRLKNKNNNSDLYLFRCNVVACDENGTPWLLLVETLLLPHFKAKEFVPLRQYFLLDEKGYDIIQRYEEDKIDTLTDKECEVLRLKYYFDMTTEEIASLLNKSVPTIKSHMQQAMEKLYAPSLQMACVMAKLMRRYE
jgi:DNA-binding CsgD family transcriptional regulator